MAGKTPVAVFYTELDMVRCFAGTGVPTLLIGSSPHNLKFYSRDYHQKRVIASVKSDPAKSLSDLIAIGREFSSKPVLFYDDDPFLSFLSQHRAALAPYYHFLMPPDETVQGLLDKTKFASLAKKFQWKVPATTVSHELQKAEDITHYMDFPCIVKPGSRIGWFESSVVTKMGGKPSKAMRANNMEEFLYIYDQIRLYTDDFVIQEYIHGGDEAIYSFHAYFDPSGKPLATFAGRKIRTYPKETGVSTYLELVHDPEVIQLGLSMLAQIGFVGPCKLDFKRDRRKNKFYLLEVNSRFNLWHHLGAASGVNIPWVVYCNLLERPTPPQTNYRVDVRWLSFGDDFRAFIGEYRTELSLWGWLSSLWGKKVYYLFTWHDPLPFFIGFLRFVKAIVRRIVGTLFS